jgi:hypothetical protein
MFKIISLFLPVSMLLLIASCGTGNTTEKTENTEKKVKATAYVTMPQNTAIAVTLVDSIDTDVQSTGDGFRARLSQSIIVDGHTLFANGAQAKGVLNKIVESGRLKAPAELDFSLTAIQDQTGNWIDVGTVMIQEDKGPHTNREVAMIGGGAIVGGIIGKIVDKKNSTEIGAVAGAAAGLGMSALTGKRDIFHGVGTDVVFFSSQSKQIALR